MLMSNSQKQCGDRQLVRGERGGGAEGGGVIQPQPLYPTLPRTLT